MDRQWTKIRASCGHVREMWVHAEVPQRHLESLREYVRSHPCPECRDEGDSFSGHVETVMP